MRVLVILPAYNEASNVGSVLGGLARHAPGHDVCVVDDGSVDGTAQVAETHGALVLRQPVNRGIGAAVRAGYRHAAREGYDAVLRLDADGQHDPREVPALLAPVLAGEADLVVGSRFLGGGAHRTPPARRLGIRYLAALVSATTGVPITDPTSGFTAAGPRTVALFARATSGPFPEAECVAHAVLAGLRVREVPVAMGPRRSGASSVRVPAALRYLARVPFDLAALRLLMGAAR